ncbi:MAG: desulfoferrodoxin FeS4 iron-binding domain-containing protein [Candidatus Pacebacteria bacterium]|nr:desulfoferrodoxin FeS4 iron-binding domain-containing protein [Candidatus Paceibacterota bacterium]
MVTKKVGDKYRCNICGNEVTLTKIGRGILVCCGKPMGKIEN